MSGEIEALREALADRYRVLEPAGHGGMATVYLAEDLKHRRSVAIKVLRHELSAQLGTDRFLREIDIAAQLQHPHIVPLYDSGSAADRLYYVMPFIEGRSLRDRLQQGPVEVTEAVRIIRDVADALAYAHDQGVVHRDIKPENIMLVERHAIVSDFGVAKALSSSTDVHALTTAGLAIGTPAYMAPEQATADPNIDHRADLYALGAIAYELLTGSPPFTGDSFPAILAAHVTQDPVPLAQTTAEIPPGVAALVMRCLAKRPDDRFPTARALLAELDAQLTPSQGLTPTGVQRAATRTRKPWKALGAVATAVLLAGAIFVAGRGTQGTGDDGVSIAVLPFTNTSGDSANEVFTSGIHDDILNQLAKIRAFKVISRTSVMEYRNTTKNVRQIGDELGVGVLLEGGVQRAGDQVRIAAQLIDVESDTHIWSNIYDRELTVQNIFAIQTEIAEDIADALQTALSPEERRQIEAIPTDDLEAYEHFQRGSEYNRRGYGETEMRIAADEYARAVELDPEFAIAWAELSKVNGLIWWFHYDRTDERLERARVAAERAVAIAPDLGEAHLALGEFYYRQLDYDAALREYGVARQLGLEDAELLSNHGYVLRRQGHFEEAVEYFERSLEIDPRYGVLASETAETFARLRRAEDAERWYARAITLVPDFAEAHYGRIRRLYLRVMADTARAREALEAAEAAGVREPNLALLWAWTEILGGNYSAALRHIEGAAVDSFATQHFYHPRSLVRAQVRDWAGERDLALADYETARADIETRLRADSSDYRAHGALGLALAGLGRAEDAVREAERGVELMPVESEAMRGFYRLEELARVHARLGQAEAASGILARLLSMPGDLSVDFLRLDPTWNPIRDHPAFRALVD